jgi:hypothetical protein
LFILSLFLLVDAIGEVQVYMLYRILKLNIISGIKAHQGTISESNYQGISDGARAGDVAIPVYLFLSRMWRLGLRVLV